MRFFIFVTFISVLEASAPPSSFPSKLHSHPLTIYPSSLVLKKRLLGTDNESGEKITFIKKKNKKKVILEKKDLSWVDLKQIRALLPHKTVEPYLLKSEWQSLWKTKPNEMKNFFSTYLNTQDKSPDDLILSSLQDPRESKMLWRSLLPSNSAKNLHHYSFYQGRNCFLTALSFFDPDINQMPYINVTIKPKHYPVMINHDEFSQALWLGYDPLSDEEVLEGLKFGDMIVLYNADLWPDYTSLLHAMIHVGGNFYFHKMSKSASSPIEFTTWESTEAIWKKNVSHLGHKIFRRKLKKFDKNKDINFEMEKSLWQNFENSISLN